MRLAHEEAELIQLDHACPECCGRLLPAPGMSDDFLVCWTCKRVWRDLGEHGASFVGSADTAPRPYKSSTFSDRPVCVACKKQRPSGPNTITLRGGHYCSLCAENLTPPVSSAIQVWRFADAPLILKVLSTAGGGEDWLTHVPARVAKEKWFTTYGIPWMDCVAIRTTVQTIQQADGSIVIIRGD